jgi:hypothetical protein
VPQHALQDRVCGRCVAGSQRVFLGAPGRLERAIFGLPFADSRSCLNLPILACAATDFAKDRRR